MPEQMIKQANNNKERQETYRYQLGRYKRAMKNEFYFEALIIVYSLLEDRLKSFLYYCGLFTNRNTLTISTKVKADIISIVFDEPPKKLPTMNNVQTKILYVRGILEWADSVSSEEISDNVYLNSLKSQIEYLDVGGTLEVLDSLSQKNTGWLAYRNEVIHASMNKNISALYEDLSEQVEKGMQCARFIDDQIKLLKQKGKVRKILKLQNN